MSQYIKPNEFTFCSKCGREHTCTLGSKSHQCRQCNIRTRDAASLAIVEAEETIGKINYQFRTRLSAIRQEYLKPLFWMTDVIKERELREKVVGWYAKVRLGMGETVELDHYQLSILVKSLSYKVTDDEIDAKVKQLKEAKRKS